VPQDAQRTVTGGYAADLLSCVMAGAAAGNVWITLQTHPNIIAVASLLDLAAVIVSECSQIEQGTVDKALSEGIALFKSAQSTYTLVARLAALGVSGQDACPSA
jgi:hypothetical protein